MNHFPIFLDLSAARVVVAGGGAAALAKLCLLLRTPATIAVFAPEPAPELERLAAEGRIRLERRQLSAGDATGALLAYVAAGPAEANHRLAALARADGALVNVVDDLAASQFITPAIVDRAPVTVAIGTEGAAPVLARALKAELEARLDPDIGTLSAAGKRFRSRARRLPDMHARCVFWAEWYDAAGPASLAGGRDLTAALEALLARHLARAPAPGRVDLVGAGPGDPEMLTLKARKALDRADVVIHDRQVAPAVLDLARREATLIEVSRVAHGPCARRAGIDDLMIRHARAGARVVRLKAGDSGALGRLQAETAALRAAAIEHAVLPGIPAAAAAAAARRPVVPPYRFGELAAGAAADAAGVPIAVAMPSLLEEAAP